MVETGLPIRSESQRCQERVGEEDGVEQPRFDPQLEAAEWVKEIIRVHWD